MERGVGAAAILVTLACTDSEGTVLHVLEPDDAQMQVDVGADAILDAGTALIRLVHLAPDVADAVDLCVAPSGGNFALPAFRARGTPSGGLPLNRASDYLALTAGDYDLRVVLAKDTTCDSAIAPDIKGVALLDGTLHTAALMGETVAPDGSSLRALELRTYPDERGADAGVSSLARFLNANALLNTVELGTGLDAGFSPLASPTPYAGVLSGGDADADGYIRLGVASTSKIFTLRPDIGPDWALLPTASSAPAITIFSAGGLGPTPSTWYALVCNDGASDGGLTACVPQQRP